MSRHTPLSINLKEIPPEGQSFDFGSPSSLSEVLKDLIGANPYEVHVQITPQGNTFDLRGTIATNMDLQCSLCAVDFKWPVQLQLHELLVPIKRPPLGKGDFHTKANHAHEWESGGPDYILLENDVFNLGEYIHEMIALAEPIRPVGKPDCDVRCDNRDTRERRPWLSYGDEGRGPEIKANPFQCLEKIKLKG